MSRPSQSSSTRQMERRSERPDNLDHGRTNPPERDHEKGMRHRKIGEHHVHHRPGGIHDSLSVEGDSQKGRDSWPW